MQVQLTNSDAQTRGLACLLLAEIGTSDSLPVLQRFARADEANARVALAARKKIMAREKEKTPKKPGKEKD